MKLVMDVAAYFLPLIWFAAGAPTIRPTGDGAGDPLELVTSLIVRMHRERNDCLLVLGHDYAVIPDAINELVKNITDGGGIIAPVHWSENTVLPPPNPNQEGNFEYWFSWMERPTAKWLTNCGFFVLIYHQGHFQPLMKYMASVVRMNPRSDRYLYYSPDNADISNDMLNLDYQFLFQIGLVPDEDNAITILSNCHFCKKGTAKIVPRGKYSRKEGLKPNNLQYFPDYSNDLNGKYINITFSVGATMQDVAYFLENDMPVFPYVRGFYLSAVLRNFDFHIEAPVEEAGLDPVLPDGNWTGLIGPLQRRESELGAALCTNDVMAVIDLCTCFFSTTITLATRMPRPLFTWGAIAKPFTLDMWAAIFGTASVVCVIFYYILKAEYTMGNPFPEENTPPTHISLYSLRFSFGALIEENPSVIPVVDSLKMLLCFYWLFCDLIVLAYESMYFGFMVSPALEPLPTSLKEMVDWPKWKWDTMDYVTDSTNMLTEFSEEAYIKKLRSALTSGQDMTKCIVKTMEEDFSCLAFDQILDALSWQFMDLEGNLPVQTIPDSSLWITAGFSTPKYSILYNSFKRYELSHVQSNMYAKFTNDFGFLMSLAALKGAREKSLSYTLSMALRISQLKAPFAIHAVIMAIAFFAFIGENTKFRMDKRKKIANNNIVPTSNRIVPVPAGEIVLRA